MEGNQRKSIVDIEGEQVFTASWMMQQIQAQNSRIDRSNRMAAISIILAAAAIILAVLL